MSLRHVHADGKDNITQPIHRHAESFSGSVGCLPGLKPGLPRALGVQRAIQVSSSEEITLDSRLALISLSYQYTRCFSSAI